MLQLLRKDLRRQRRQVPLWIQKQSEQQVLNRILTLAEFKKAQKIGIYLDAFGEIKTNLIIQKCFDLGKQVYLPMICNMNQKLVWIRIYQHQYNNRRFSHHRLGMKEPMASRGQDVSKLDLLFMPLLACDRFGTRLGMGGGFYDRTLANNPIYPLRFGLAHDFQLLEQPLYRQKWDQALDVLVTPSQRLNFKRTR